MARVREGRAGELYAFHADRASHHFDQPLTHHQPDACAFFRARLSSPSRKQTSSVPRDYSLSFLFSPAPARRTPQAYSPFASAGFFPLPGGLPRFFVSAAALTSASHFGGRPRRLPSPICKRSIARMLSSTWSRSSRSCWRMASRSISRLWSFPVSNPFGLPRDGHFHGQSPRG